MQPITTASALDAWIVDLHPPTELRPTLLACLSADERRHAKALRSRLARETFQMTRASLRLHLARYIGVAPDALIIARDQYGKPFLHGQGAIRPLRFNISHSYDFALMCFSRTYEVGCDIEKIRPIPDARLVAQRSFAPGELRSILEVNLENLSTRFLNCWTRKEALTKGLGLGLRIPLDAFDVVPVCPMHMVIWHRPFPISAPWLTALVDLPDDGYCGAIALSPIPSGNDASQALRPAASQWDFVLTYSQTVHQSWTPAADSGSVASFSSR